MGILDLDKIIIKRTIVGIRCIACGGNLVVSEKRSFAARFIKIASFGSIRPESYVCETCKKGFLLI
jgi:DNA-directed RNA polymerase subunit RPC12/RpoP